ncbi:16S rRNA (adenine(1518)-N(6)/adenine(1519)-N(6))-dimethyltransferase RsmA [Bauldia sp.]|uniref:16S rRNA (adenine(1518)-N(6)/adenine(1519)-N(6))- dimethyltransferase RsmA n=1 Tax=Bauldia sp. TaxID=2575872 RepID=UPI003BA920DE
MDDLPPLREVIARLGLSADKRLGQNFLLDLNLTARIARAAGDLSATAVIEVGPGPGGLTRALLAAGVPKVVVIERDRRCLPALEEIGAHYSGRLEVISGDALDIDYTGLVDGPSRIVSNLPYNIATPLLVKWLRIEPWPPPYLSLTLMFQKEVAARITATPGTKAYGRLGVLAGWRSDASTLFDISPKAFTPPPKVTSTLVQIVPKPRPLPCDPAALERVTAAAFGQRRKMLRQSLRSLGVDPNALLETAGLDPTDRAEDIDIAGFVALANAVTNRSVPSPVH